MLWEVIQLLQQDVDPNCIKLLYLYSSSKHTMLFKHFSGNIKKSNLDLEVSQTKKSKTTLVEKYIFAWTDDV